MGCSVWIVSLIGPRVSLLCDRRNAVQLREVITVVLDEADEMLRMGFQVRAR